MAKDAQLEGLLAPDICALVIVDLQNDYCHPSGALGAAGLGMSSIDAMCEKVALLREAAERSRVLTVMLRTIHSEATDSPAWLRRGSFSGLLCRDGTWGAEAYGVAPGPADVVITKHRYSGFVGTRLDHVLRAASRTTVVLVGTATNVCVESTARDACMRDYDVVVASDATAASDPREHMTALENVRRYFGSVVSSDRVLASWATATRAKALGRPA